MIGVKICTIVHYSKEYRKNTFYLSCPALYRKYRIMTCKTVKLSQSGETSSYIFLRKREISKTSIPYYNLEWVECHKRMNQK